MPYPGNSKSGAAEAMRKLPQAEREEAIAASDNVIGYDRFMAKHRQVELRDAYRKPSGPPEGGHA